MLLINNRDLETWNSLFWQPMFSCGMNRDCAKHCYVAQSRMKQENENSWKQLVDRLYLKKDLDCHHLTIAIDQKMFKKNPEGKSWWDVVWSRLLFHRACGDYRHTFHLTCSLTDLGRLVKAFNEEDPALGKLEDQFLSLISISIPAETYIGDIELHTFGFKGKTRLGANIVVGDDASEEDCATQAIQLAQSQEISQVYLVLQKMRDPTLQQYFLMKYEDVTNIIMRRGNYANRDLHLLNEIPDLQLTNPVAIFNPRKIVMDQCLRRQLPKKRTCGAGIERIALWPNGEVTACPYDGQGNHKVDSIYGTNHFRDYPVDFCQHCTVRRALNEPVTYDRIGHFGICTQVFS